MATITLNGQEVEIADDERLNVIQAAERAGIDIPYYCWHPGLTVVASCRMCLVEVGQKTDDGTAQMGPRLVPACQTPARDRTVVVTDSEKVKENRRAVEEYLLLDHPVDCPICDRAGECHLQDYYYQHGRSQRRDLPEPFTSRRKNLGPEITLFTDRCVMCSRCVRFTREVSGTAELHIVERGNSAEIDVFPGYPIDNKLSGNVVDLCPVGALCSRDFLYQQRVWFLRAHKSICTGCSTGCSITVDESRDEIYRLKPRHNPNVNDWWICDEGRLGYKYVASPDRLKTPRRRTGGALHEAEWPEVLRAIREDLDETVRRHGGNATVCVLSPMLTCEEAYVLVKYLKTVSQDIRLALGPIPVVGEDDRFPKTPNGSEAATRFTIRAEKCPNRRGIVEIILAFQGELVEFDALPAEIDAGSVKTAFLTAGYARPWQEFSQTSSFAKLELVILVDILRSEAAEKVDYLLPGAAWVEKSGSYVNCAGVLQSTERAVRPPGDARPEGRIFWELAERERLFHSGDVLGELARAVPFFAACAAAEIPQHGIRLAEPDTLGAEPSATNP